MNRELFELSLQSIRRKRRNSLLLFAVLFLSFAFAIVSLTVTGSIQKTNQEYRYDVYGEWFGAIPEGQMGDKSFLQRREWLSEMAFSQSCGTILTSGGKYSGGAGIGVADETFLKMGRIKLEAGHFPESPNEIAVESDLLGSAYTLGQEVTFEIRLPVTRWSRNKYKNYTYEDSSTVTAKVSFTLCGVLKKYTNLWVDFGSDLPLLNSAIITSEGVEPIRQAGEEEAEAYRKRENLHRETVGNKELIEKIKVDSPTPQFFFTVVPGEEETARREVMRHLRSTQHLAKFQYKSFDRMKSRELFVNTSTSSVDEETTVGYYTWLILGVTLLAVVCIYTIRMQDEARQLAIFRSIGVTKRQLCIMLLYETLLLGAPAMVLGTAGGAFGTWAVLKLTMYSKSVHVYVVIQPILLAIMAGLWIVGVLAARLAVFLVALRAPLTGRFHVARKKARRYTNLRRAMIAGLSVLLCTALLFTAVESVEPIQVLQYLDTTYDFVVTKSDKIGWQNDGDVIPNTAEGKVLYDVSYLYKNALLSTEYKDSLSQIPGVEKIYGWGQQYVRLDFDGMQNAKLLKTSMENYHVTDRELQIKNSGMLPSKVMRFPPGIGPYDPKAAFTFLLIVDDGDWEGMIDFDGVDEEKFRSGEQVLLSFYLNENGKFETDYQYEGSESEFEETDLGIAKGDTVRITAGAEEDSFATVEAEVGGILVYPNDFISEIEQLNHQYTVICSGEFVKKLLDGMGRNASWHIYRQLKPYGYRRMFLYLDKDADLLASDAALSEFCAREKLHLNTGVRNWKQATNQQNTQKLILIFSGGACMALVLLLILWNALSLEAERKKRSIGIQQALGMSRKQTSRRQFSIAALRGGLGVLLGWLAYSGYWAALRFLNTGNFTGEYSPVNTWLAEQQQGFDRMASLTAWNWTDWPVILLLTALCVALVLGVSYLANRRLMKEDLMAKLRDEH